MTSSHYDDWPNIAARLRRDLADGLDVAGVVEETDVLTRIGATSFEVVIDSSDLEATEQATAYVALRDLLATRMRQGAEQVLADVDRECLQGRVLRDCREHVCRQVVHLGHCRPRQSGVHPEKFSTWAKWCD